MYTIISIVILFAALNVEAKTYYYLDGKQVNQGEALIASLKEGKEIMQVKVNHVKANPQTARLNKNRDGEISEIPR